MFLIPVCQNIPRPQGTSPKAIFAVSLSSTPSEGVAFSRHFPTPSEGVGDAHHRYRHQRAIFTENLSSTPSEGVAFPRLFPTPSEGVRDAHPRHGHQRAIFAENLPSTPSEGVENAHHRYGYTESRFNEFTSGCTLSFNRLKISGMQMKLHIWPVSKGGGCAVRFAIA